MKRLLLLLLLSNPSYAIDNDKQLHLGLSTAIGYSTNYFIDNNLVKIGACVGVGLAKEVYDEIDYSGFSREDLVYDTIGCTIGVLTGDIISLKLTDDSVFVGLDYKY